MFRAKMRSQSRKRCRSICLCLKLRAMARRSASSVHCLCSQLCSSRERETVAGPPRISSRPPGSSWPVVAPAPAGAGSGSGSASLAPSKTPPGSASELAPATASHSRLHTKSPGADTQSSSLHNYFSRAQASPAIPKPTPVAAVVQRNAQRVASSHAVGFSGSAFSATKRDLVDYCLIAPQTPKVCLGFCVLPNQTST